jgi:glycosyltransferase involved in cell wall biosynthesis
MTSLEILRKEPVFFYTNVPIAPYGQGSSMRVFTNLRTYADLGFKIELIHIVDQASKRKKVVLPEGDIHYTQVFRHLRVMNFYIKQIAIRLGKPNRFLLNAIFPERWSVIQLVRGHFTKHPQAIYHFEYDNFASAAIAFKDIKAIWSNHDVFSERVPLIWKMRDQQKLAKRRRAPRELTLKRVRYIEDLIAQNTSLILNIAEHEYIKFNQVRNYSHSVLFPMSWPDERMVKKTRTWREDNKLRMLHLGSVNGFIAFESLRYIIGKVLPLLPTGILNKLELWVVGTLADSFYCNRIREMAQDFPQIRFFGFVEDLRNIYSQVDVQVVGGLQATGLRTRIIESMVYGVPVLSTIEMAKGLHQLVNSENIMLVKDAHEFAVCIINLAKNSKDLNDLITKARLTYDLYYSRQNAAKMLSDSLKEYL